MCSNDPRIAFDLFTARSNIASPYIYMGDKVEKSFSQNTLKTNG